MAWDKQKILRTVVTTVSCHIILIPQMIAALLIGMGYYMLAMVMTVYDGVLSLIFQPIVGFIITTIAIFSLLVIGLPIRFIRPINRWWRAHWWLTIGLAGTAFVMMCAAWLPMFRVQDLHPERNVMINSPNPILGLGGWLLTLFCVLHFYPPFFLLGRVLNKIKMGRMTV